MSYYKQFLTKDQKALPVAQKIHDEILSLPIYPTMTKKERSAVTMGVTEALPRAH
jgi:dTDP-4-amino-4,6-dideoxygalactose transaminase